MRKELHAYGCFISSGNTGGTATVTLSGGEHFDSNCQTSVSVMQPKRDAVV